jgi:hypothetical protein
MKVEKKQNPSIFLTTDWNLSYKYSNIGFFFQNLVNLGQFFHKKSFVEFEIILFRLKFGKISTMTKTIRVERLVSKQLSAQGRPDPRGGLCCFWYPNKI